MNKPLFRRHQNNLPSSDSLVCESLEERMMLSTVQLIGAGTTGQEIIELEINGSVVQTWNDLGDGAYSGDYVTRTFSTGQDVTADQVRINFTNDLYENGVDRNVRIDAIVIDGIRYETEDPGVYSTGTWLAEDGIVAGFRLSEYLHTDGYLQFAGDGGDQTAIQVRASGNEGGETFQLQIDGQVVETWTATTGFQTFTHNASGSVTADQIRIEFTNDLWDPANNIDRNLNVDFISVGGEVIQTESANVYSTGTWLAADGIVPGFRLSETLHSNGYFEYDAQPQPQSGNIGFTLDTVTVDENSGDLNFIVFRADGSDGTVTVDYQTVNGSANTSDYQPISGTLTFGPGITGQQLTVSLTDDNQVEGDETFNLVLSNPTGGASLGAITSQSVTIRDNDEIVAGVIFEDGFEGATNWTTNPFNTDTATTGAWAAGAPQSTTSGGTSLQLDSGSTGSRALVTGLAAGASVGSYDVDNGVTSVLSPEISLQSGAEIELSFDYYLAYLDNATADDYFHVSIVSNGTQTEIYDDHAHEFNQSAAWQTVALDLSPFAGQTVQILFEAADAETGSLIESAVDNVQVEVLPNAPGTFQVETTGVNLDEASGFATMVVTRTAGRSGTATVNYRTVAGTASTADFTPRSGTLTFADGQSEASVNIPIVDDNIEESLESFRFELFNPTGGAVIGNDDFGTVTIVDNDNTVGDYLPDLLPIASTLTERLSIDTSEQPGRSLLRFSTEVANAGDGPLEIWGGTATGSSQQVFQRIYQEDGGSRDVLAGEFVYHPGHGHIHFEGFATYDLQLLDANGTIIASGGKTSFCLINIRQPLPDATNSAAVVHGRGGNSCGNVQGISVGYSDVYSASLDDQWIDITNVADGSYSLQITADPDNNIRETNESNNVSSVTITIQNGQVISG